MNDNDTGVIASEKQGGGNTQNDKDKRTPLQDAFDIIDAVIVAMVAAVFILTLVLRTGYVDGPSMEPTMLENDRYLVSGFFYVPKQGDIVVFQPDSEYNRENKLWVKRVIAVAGQVVDIDAETHEVLVNGVVLNEPYLSGAITYKKTDSSVEFPLEVPDGYIFVLGDNRGLSLDSRSIGCVDVRRILGRVLLRFYPLDKMGVID